MYLVIHKNCLPRSSVKTRTRLSERAQFHKFEKMENSGPRLGDIPDLKILNGIKTGYNKAFIIDANIRNQIISADQKSSLFIKRLLVGDDIRTYEYHYRENYLLLY